MTKNERNAANNMLAKVIRWHRRQANKSARGSATYAWQTEGEGDNPYDTSARWHHDCADRLKKLKVTK